MPLIDGKGRLGGVEEADVGGAGQGDGLHQRGLPRLGNVKEPFRPECPERGEARVGQDRVDGTPVAAGDERVKGID